MDDFYMVLSELDLRLGHWELVPLKVELSGR